MQETIDESISQLCTPYLAAIDPNHGNKEELDKAMKGVVVAHCLSMMLAYEFLEQDDKSLLDDTGKITNYVLARFQEGLDDYEAFKAEFHHKGGKMFVPDDHEMPYFEFNPTEKAPSP